ncbi:MAG TPA: ABC transporter ATP-binding protein, partial [Planctomycetota bacterium]|nr:ABC transporter ATP-binding protein [Planctomycetota bacterium]
EVFGFIGPNGAGKTSTIKVLATLIRPAFGSARIDGISTAARPAHIRRIIGYMPDFFGVYDDLTVNEYLHFFAAAYRMGRAKRRSVVGDVLSLTDLAAKRDTPVDALSRGMKQRLGLARVLLHDPQLLLLDEPASGLDPRARIEIRELLKELKNMGKTILVSSHILHELSQICTRMGIIEAGQMVAEGSLHDVYAQLSIHRVVHVRVANLTDALLEKIRGIRGVASASQEIDRIVVELRQETHEPEELLHELMALGARVSMFQPEAMDMETVFMKLTRGKTA